jgi:hypothetical protein
MVCVLCYEKSLRWQLQDYVCPSCKALFIVKPTKHFCEVCRYKTLPFPLRPSYCSGCGGEYQTIINIIEEIEERTEQSIDAFLGDEEE